MDEEAIVFIMHNVFIIIIITSALAVTLKEGSHPQLQQLLSSIPSISVALVNLEYKEEVLPPAHQAVCSS